MSSTPPPNQPNARRTYSATFLRAGHVLQADGQSSNWLIPAEVLEHDAHLFEGLACYLDHPQLFGFGVRGEPQVRDLFGVTSHAYYDPFTQAIEGQITLYDQDPNSAGAFVAHLMDQILADKEAGKPVPPLGLSAVFFQDADYDDETGKKVTTAFRKVESLDLVYSPGAGGYIKQALAAMPARPTDYQYPTPQACGIATATHTPNTLGPDFQSRATRSDHSPAPTTQRRNTMPPENDQDTNSPAEDFDAGAIGAQVAGLNAAVKHLQGQVKTLTADLDGSPPVTVDQTAATIEDLHAQVQHLTNILAKREAPIQGVGQSVHLGPRLSVTDPLPVMQNAWDWIFGAPDATTPPPELRRTDYLYRLLSGDLNWTGVFDEREALAAANATTMAGMVVNAMNKVIVPLYDRLAVYRWFEQIVTVQPTDGSLHDMAWLQFGGIGDLPVVADGAAYSELSVDDSKESDAFTKYGGYVGITEKVLRNSDVAKIQAIPRALVVAAVQTRSAKIAAIFTTASGTGPTLDQDSTVLFHANHGNLATTAFSFAAWKAARIECAKARRAHQLQAHRLLPQVLPRTRSTSTTTPSTSLAMAPAQVGSPAPPTTTSTPTA